MSCRHARRNLAIKRFIKAERNSDGITVYAVTLRCLNCTQTFNGEIVLHDKHIMVQRLSVRQM